MMNPTAKIHDETNGLNYTLHGDYCLSDIEIDQGHTHGKCGREQLRYLKEQRPGLYTRLLLSGKLNDDCYQAGLQAEHLLETMLPRMAEESEITALLKADDPMKWVGTMNTIKAQVEEIIRNECAILQFNPHPQYGRTRMAYLLENCPGLYTRLFLAGKLCEHLAETDSICREGMSCMIQQMAAAEGINGNFKASDPMAWVGWTNSIHQRAEETIVAELIYV